MYATGSCANHKLLLDAVSAFAVANAGFTETVRRTFTKSDDFSNNVTVTYTLICLSKGVDHFWLAAAVTGSNYIRGYHARNNDGSGYLDATDRVPSGVEFVAGLVLAPFLSYHLFTEGNAVHVAGQGSSGGFVHFNFGHLIKYATFDGGAYMLGSVNLPSSGLINNPNLSNQFYLTGTNQGLGSPFATYSFLRVLLGTVKYARLVNSSPGIGSGTISNMYITGLTAETGKSILRDTPSQFNGRAAGIRFECFIDDAVAQGGVTNLWRPLGYIPNIRAINITNLNPLDLINTDWMVFPCNAKVGIVDAQNNTFGYGWAVKK